jgi:hypothetical protein
MAHSPAAIKAARDAAIQRIAARIQQDKRVADLRNLGRFSRLLAEANMSFVRHGALRELREDQYDAAVSTNRTHDIEAAYAVALMGGEPYGIWN